MAGKGSSQKGSGSRKHGRNSRSGGITHSVSLYRSRSHRAVSTRGNHYHRPAGVCANCESKVGPFIAGPDGTRICDPSRWVRVGETSVPTIVVCNKRRADLDWQRFTAKLRAV